MGYKMVCDCECFNRSMDKIVQAQTLAWSHGSVYDGDVFVFCPWCGVELRRVNEPEVENRSIST